MAMVSSCFAQDSGQRFTRFSRFSLGNGTLSEIAASLAPVEMEKTGDAGEFMASICYRTREGFVAFLAGEMDGPEHTLGGILVSKNAVRSPCSDWPAKISPPRLAVNHLRLGMSIGEFKRIVGQPISWSDGWAIASFDSKRKLTTGELERQQPDVQATMKQGNMQDYFDVSITVSARFIKGRLQEFRVWKVETL
jgi:hypothetical protein